MMCHNIRMSPCSLMTQKKTQTLSPGWKHTVDAELANTHNTIKYTNVPQIDTDNALQESTAFQRNRERKQQ